MIVIVISFYYRAYHYKDAMEAYHDLQDYDLGGEISISREEFIKTLDSNGYINVHGVLDVYKTIAGV